MARRRLAALVLVGLAAYWVAVTVVARPRPTRTVPVPGRRAEAIPSRGPERALAPQPAANESQPAVPPGAWVLPGPSRYQGVAGVGYLNTTLGAVALGYSALAARFTTDPDIAVSVVRATALAPSPTLLQEVAQGTEALRTRFGLTPTGPTPTTIGLSLIGCQVQVASPTRVVAGYEGTLSVEGGAVQGTTADVSVAIALVWDGADWKIDPTGDLPTPPISFPTAAAATEGWHGCSED